MMFRKVHCLFEQSGTFKGEFQKMGTPAFDYDIRNEFGQTDYIIDLFGEIENGYEGEKSIFNDITKDDLILAFFPCIYFQTTQMTYYDDTSTNLRSLKGKQRYDVIIDRINKRNKFHTLLYKLYAIAKIRGLKLIIENPANVPSYLIGTQNFPPPSFIDKDRTRRGDYYRKPTAYWFVNIEQTFGFTHQKTPKQLVKSVMKVHSNTGGEFATLKGV